MISRAILLAGAAGAALIAAAAPTLAFADTATDTASATRADALDAAADSAQQTESHSRGDVIIVTARRRQETAQEVPLAISVIKADSIESTGNFNVVKLQQLAPTLQVYTSNPRNTSVNIRGLGVPFGLTSDGFEQGVGIYVDDVYNARVAAATFDFLDVEQVEVLRGPQGTLYGKNTTAGAINITTNQPTFDFEGRAELTVGNLNYRQAKAAISGPLSDTVAARIAVASTSRRGTLFNTATDRWINVRTIWACAGRSCSSRATISASRCPAITASRTRNAAAPCLFASARPSGLSLASTMRWSRRSTPPIRAGTTRCPAATRMTA